MFNLVDLNVDFFLQLEVTKLHVAIHTLSLNHSVKFAPVVTSLHVEWLILGTTEMPNPTLYYIALHCIVLYCIVLHCFTLHCIVLHCFTLHCIVLQ